jgi:hypothetical protein
MLILFESLGVGGIGRNHSGARLRPTYPEDERFLSLRQVAASRWLSTSPRTPPIGRGPGIKAGKLGGRTWLPTGSTGDLIGWTSVGPSPLGGPRPALFSTGQHSARIQGTFREHSGNIQGTLRERSVKVEVGANEPPSQLQEALKESTKVDAKSNLQT